MIDPEAILSRLNPPQREAVTHGEGPLLILAGAGSGKTRVITHRIAYLIGAMAAAPRDVVAMTFTNKAAGEMRERVERRLGRDVSGAFIGTFHAFGLRILRANAIEAGFPPSFVIYDTTDQLALVRGALKELGIDDKAFPPRQVRAWISRTKNELIDPEAAQAQARFPHEKAYAACYEAYEEGLLRAGAADFDDLLVKPVRLFRARPEIAERYARRTRWLLVDEYQDTNPIQYALIRLLTSFHGNVCCVGDEDQSIYAFRGADIRNILDFTRDFPEAKVVKLEQNYRSTGNILASASAVIRHNTDRHEKTLWTENPEGKRLTFYMAQDDRSEADFVVESMLAYARESEIPLDEMAILYRTNATSRLFEDRLASRNISYRIVGSLRFYDRKEIKDLLAWIRLIVHPDSSQDFLRAVGTPPRGIGAKTVGVLAERAERERCSLHEAAVRSVSDPGNLSGRAVAAIKRFVETLRDLTSLSESITTAACVTSVIDAIDYLPYLEKAYPADHTSRGENLDALVSAAEEHDEAGAPDLLAGFLDRVSLRSDTDDVQGSRGPSLMTVHSAKGLEFDIVFIAGLNEDLFPHSRAAAEDGGIEEERRLMYVAMTRARKLLVLSAAHFRRQFGEPVLSRPSSFLGEIPSPLLESRQAEFQSSAARTPAGGVFGGWQPSRGGVFRERGSATGPRYAETAGRRRTGGGRGRKTQSPGAGSSGPSAVPAAGLGRRGGEIAFVPDPEAAAGETFRRGMTVSHPVFGRGRVLEITGSGERLILDIRFERAGRKRILPRHTALTIEP